MTRCLCCSACQRINLTTQRVASPARLNSTTLQNASAQPRRAESISFGVTRIGIHSGAALVGDFGSGHYVDYTAYGDTINTVARLQAANKVFNTRICASSAVAERMPRFQGRPIGDLMLRGRSEALRAYEPLSPERFALPATAAYAAAFAKLQCGDTGALPAFAALVGSAEADSLANLHLRRLLNGGSGVQLEVR